MRLNRWPVSGPFARRSDREQPREGDGEPPLAPPPEPPVAPVVVPRWIQAVVLPLALLGLWELARASGPVLLILTFASVIALILNPVAKRFERVLPRGLSILAVFVAGIAILTVIGALLSSPITAQVNRFEQNVPQIVKQANHELASIQHFFDTHGIRVHIQKQGQTALQTLEHTVLKSSSSLVSFSRNLLGQIVTLGVDILLTVVLAIYLLVYARQIGELARRVMPPGDGTPEDDFPLMVQRAASGYVRGQLLFSVIMGGSAGIALALFGVAGVFPDGLRYAVFFGAFYGIAELIPYVGPIIGAVPPVLVALFTHPIAAVWLVLLFVVLQQLEGHLVAPQVFRISLRINPIIVILALLVGYQIYGIAGALVALPVATITKETILYLRRHLVLESWSQPGAGPPGPSAGAPSAGAPSAGAPSAGAPSAGGGAPGRAPAGGPIVDEELGEFDADEITAHHGGR